MNFLHKFYFGEGPGIPKDAPRPKGLRLLAHVLGREWWDLLRLNLLCVAFSLPLITLPAAYFATMSVCADMIEDRNVYLWRDFWRAFRSRLLVATGLGLLFCAAGALGVVAVRSYIEGARENLVLALPLTIAITVTCLLPLLAAYVFTALAKRADRPLSDVLKAGVLGLIARPGPGLAALLFVALLWVAHILFYPVSVFLPVLVNFSLGALVTTFAALKGVEFGFSRVASDNRRGAGQPEVLSA